MTPTCLDQSLYDTHLSGSVSLWHPRVWISLFMTPTCLDQSLYDTHLSGSVSLWHPPVWISLFMTPTCLDQSLYDTHLSGSVSLWHPPVWISLFMTPTCLDQSLYDTHLSGSVSSAFSSCLLQYVLVSSSSLPIPVESPTSQSMWARDSWMPAGPSTRLRLPLLLEDPWTGLALPLGSEDPRSGLCLRLHLLLSSRCFHMSASSNSCDTTSSQQSFNNDTGNVYGKVWSDITFNHKTINILNLLKWYCNMSNVLTSS